VRGCQAQSGEVERGWVSAPDAAADTCADRDVGAGEVVQEPTLHVGDSCAVDEVELEDECVEVLRARSVITGVASEHGEVAAVVGCEVVGPCGWDGVWIAAWGRGKPGWQYAEIGQRETLGEIVDWATGADDEGTAMHADA
jgi:hypothetical protein